MPSSEQIFLTFSVNKLNQMTGHIESCFAKLNADQIWARGHETENSLGNLVLHLTGNVRQWIGWGIGGLPDIRVRDQEFAYSKMDPQELLASLKATIKDAIGILEHLPPERLTERVATQDGDRYVLELVYQVVGHFQQHTGQIMFSTKQLTGEDLKFYTPPKKSS